jgi:hypothetical protein
MRRLIRSSALVAFAVVFLLAAVAWAQETKDEAPQGPQPNCLIEELRHDMGEVFEQERYVYEFKVKNLGDANLEIVSVRPG